MNINKHLILLFSVLFFLFAVSVSSGCFRKNESDVKSVVRNELDQLKNLEFRNYAKIHTLYRAVPRCHREY